MTYAIINDRYPHGCISQQATDLIQLHQLRIGDKMKSIMMTVAMLSILWMLCLQSHASVLKTSSQPLELLILHNNDIHARFEQISLPWLLTCSEADAQGGKCVGGFARIATVVKQARAEAASGSGPPVLFLNAGDTYTGTVWDTLYKWKISAAFLNMLKPDAVSLGNHELDHGASGLAPFIANLTCPVLAANLKFEYEPMLDRETNLMKSYVFDVNNTKVGVIGYLTPDTKWLVPPNQVEYESEVSAIQREVEKLKGEGVQILIALGHSGYEADKVIAEKVADIDLVIGGHTDTFLWNGHEPSAEKKQGPYPTLIRQKSGKIVPVVQAYAFTKYLGKLRVKFDDNGDLIEHDGQPILLDSSIPQDQEALDLLQKYRPGIDELLKHVEGSSRVLLDGSQLKCRLAECNIGNFLTDAMVHAYMLEYKGVGWTDAPIAIRHGGGIRSSLPVGNITRGDIMTVLPFDHKITAVNMTGSKLREALEASVLKYDPLAAPGSFLQYSGMEVVYDLTKKPGSRVTSASARCGDCLVPTYSELEDEKYYKILMPDFLYSGGDGYRMFKGDDAMVEFMSYNDVDTVVTYLKTRSPIYAEVSGRITIKRDT